MKMPTDNENDKRFSRSSLQRLLLTLVSLLHYCQRHHRPLSIPHKYLIIHHYV